MVNVDTLDSINLRTNQFRQFLDEEQLVSLVCITTCSLNHLVVTGSLLGEHFEVTLSLSFHLSEDSVSFTLCLHTSLFSLSFSLDDTTFLLDFLSHEDVSSLGRTFTFSTSILGLLLSCISFLQGACTCYLLSSTCLTLSLSLSLTTNGIRVGNLNLGFVLTLHSKGVSLAGTDTSFTLSVSLTDFTHLVLLSYTNLSFVDSLCSSLTTESLDITALVLDIRHVHVDQSQTYLLQFHFHVSADSLKELITVVVQLLDTHRCDHQTQLTEEDITSQFLNLSGSLTQQTFSSSSHVLRVSRYTHRESARNVHTDVLPRQRIRQVRIDADRRQAQVSIVLNDRPHERTSTMNTLSRTTITRCSIHYKDFVRRTTSVSVDD